MTNKEARNALKKVLRNRIAEIKQSMKSNDFETMFDIMYPDDYVQFLDGLDNDNLEAFADWLSENGREEKLQRFIQMLSYEDEIRLIFAAISPKDFCSKMLDEQYSEILNEMSTEQIYQLYVFSSDDEKLWLIWRLQSSKLESFISGVADKGSLAYCFLAMRPEDFEATIKELSCEALNLLIFSAEEPLKFCECLSDERFSDVLNQMKPEQIYHLFKEFKDDEDGAIDMIGRLQEEKFEELIQSVCTEKEPYENLTNRLFQKEELKGKALNVISNLEPARQAQMIRNADDKGAILEVVWKPELLKEFSAPEIVQLIQNTEKMYQSRIFADLANADYTDFWDDVPAEAQIAFLKMAKVRLFAINEVFSVADFLNLFLEVGSDDKDFLIFEILLAQENDWMKEFYGELVRAEKLEVLEMAYRPDENDDEFRVKQRIVLASKLRYVLEGFESLEKYEKVFLEYFEKE